jgi:hypothetical protein
MQTMNKDVLGVWRKPLWWLLRRFLSEAAAHEMMLSIEFHAGKEWQQKERGNSYQKLP